METKPFYLSKMFWVQLMGLLGIAVGAKVPAVADFIKNYFAELGSGWALVNMALRFISKDKLSLS